MPDSAGDVGLRTSLELTSAGWPTISYLDETNWDLKYAYKDTSGWHTETVDSVGDVGDYTSLALTSTDTPAISYLDQTNRDLKYAYKSAPNQAPTAEAGPDQPSAHIGAKVTLQGSGTDPGNDLQLTYSWNIKTKPEGSSATLSGENTATPSFTPDIIGDYTIELVVTDSLGAKSTPDSVIVTAGNKAPTANAGSDRSIHAGTLVTLDGSQSKDPDGAVQQYAWTLIDAPEGSDATLSDPTIVNPTFIPDKVGKYVFELMVTDDDGAQSLSAASVTITATNDPPTADAGADQSVHVGTPLSLDGSGSADPNGDGLTYSWTITTAPSTSSATITDATSAKAGVTPDVIGTYEMKLTVTDSFGATSSASTKVEATNTPAVADAGTDQTKTVRDTVTLDGRDSTTVTKIP